MPISLAGAPVARDFAAAWTGTELVVWGGFLFDESFNHRPLTTGARYDPNTDSWTAMAEDGSEPVSGVAVSAGAEVIFW
jgi:hypothetical protein